MPVSRDPAVPALVVTNDRPCNIGTAGCADRSHPGHPTCESIGSPTAPFHSPPPLLTLCSRPKMLDSTLANHAPWRIVPDALLWPMGLDSTRPPSYSGNAPLNPTSSEILPTSDFLTINNSNSIHSGPSYCTSLTGQRLRLSHLRKSATATPTPCIPGLTCC